MTGDALFPVDGLARRPDRDRYVTPDMGADAARTARRRAAFEDGVHPATGHALLDRGATRCGSCTFLWFKSYGASKGWWKCTVAGEGRRHGHGPDMVRAWPACTAYQPDEQ